MRTRVAVAIALAVIVAYSFWLRWRILGATPFPTGIDGYFYPVELRSLLAHGELAYPAPPLAFWFMAPFAAIAGPIVGAKLGAAVGGALVALPAYALGSRLGRSWGAGLLAASLATFSAGSTYLTIEYVKNGIGITVALAAVWLVLRAIETPSRGRLVAAGLAILAAILAHKMAAAVVVCCALPAAFTAAIGRGALRGRRLLYLVIAAGGLLLGLLVLGIVAPRRSIAPADLAMMRGLFGSRFTWDALATEHVTLAMGHDALIGGVLAIGAAVALVLRGELLAPAERTVAWVIVGFGLLIAFPLLAVDDPQGLGFRLRIVAYVPRALCAAVIVGVLPRHDLAVALLALVIAVIAPRDEQSEGEIITHPALVTAALALQGQIPADGVAIVPERHIAFMVAWYADVPVSLRPEPVPRDRRWRVMPLSFIGAGSPLDAALTAARAEPSLVPPLGLHPRHPNGMVLVAEPTWEWILAHMPPPAQRHFIAWPTI